MEKDYLIGVDFNANTISAGLVDLTGKIIKKVEMPTDAKKGKKQVLDNLFAAISKVKKSHVIGIGIGVPGYVDKKRGIIHNAPNLPDWKDVNLKRMIEERINLPTYIDNDINCFALAESKCGSGKKIDNFVVMSIGSGVGSGIVINGKIYRGTNDCAAEIGHTVVVENGDKCNCGNYGCLETYSSGLAIERRFKDATKKRMTYEEIAKEYSKNKKAKEIINDAGKYLGVGIANVINFLNPELVIVGGPVIRIVKPIAPLAFKEAQRRALSIPAERVKIMESTLEDAGIIGAASILEC